MASTDSLTDIRRRIADFQEHQGATKHERRSADRREVAGGVAAAFGPMDELAPAIEDLQRQSQKQPKSASDSDQSPPSFLRRVLHTAASARPQRRGLLESSVPSVVDALRSAR